MKKTTFKTLLIFCFTLFSLLVIAQTAPDEDVSSDLSCSPEFTNATRTSSDLPNPVNVGTIDDRSCYADYSESNVYGKTWGVYNITDGSNHFGGTLQPRIERSLRRSQATGVGSYARFTGTFRILEVGETNNFNTEGTYIAQAKGKHTGGGGSADPAICLFLAKPVMGTGADADKQIAFNIYAERILYRGGEGSGREFEFITQVNKDVETNFELEVGFRVDPNDSTKKIHFCDVVIGGVVEEWNIPEPERGTESGIRYGAYRVKGGRAQIRWTDTFYDWNEEQDNNGPGPSDEIYRLRNVATGKFLTAVGNSATPVTMTDSGEPINTHWTFVETGAYFNIDNQGKVNNSDIDALRAVNDGSFLVFSTGKDTPTSDTDKTWTIHYNEIEDTYRFETRFGTYLYHETDGSVTHKNFPESDTRSVWEAIPTSQSLSISDKELSSSSIKIYPNPARGEFTIAFQNINNIRHLEIYNILGKRVYQNAPKSRILEFKNAGFKTGIYLVKAIADDNKVYHTKLVIK